ncbi:MAG: NAD(P)-binding protein [Microbacteriaceae bacterium]
MNPYLIVGAGASGLGVAHGILEFTNRDVHIFDRVPVPGGEAGWDNKFLGAKFNEIVSSPRVTFRLGQTATRWSGSSLTLLGPGKAMEVPGQHLFYAGGVRPSTAADLKISGDRPAGVIPATVAEHLLRSGEAIWDRPLLVGDEHWCAALSDQIHRYGGQVQGLKGSEAWADITHDVEGELVVEGNSRITSVHVGTVIRNQTIECDALILASSPRPNRNVVGALFDDDDGVTFVQPIEVEGTHNRFEVAYNFIANQFRLNGESDES